MGRDTGHFQDLDGNLMPSHQTPRQVAESGVEPDVSKSDVRIDHPVIGSGMTVPGNTKETFTTDFRGTIRRFTVDVPADVVAECFRDSQRFFRSPGNESGEEVFDDQGLKVRSQIKTILDNTTAGDEQVRVTYIGPPELRPRTVA